MLKVEAVSYSVGTRTLVRDVTFTLRPGELLAIAGANGAGKSTLLDLLNGSKKADKGSISLYKKSISKYRSEQLALLSATLSQYNMVNMPFTVQEIVSMGRYPHYGLPSQKNDEKSINEATSICGVSNMKDRSFLSLSGGEQQRVHLARVLAQIWDQEEALLIMDEPTGGLDMEYQQQILAIAKALSKKGFMIITVLHELNLAAQYADRILLLKNGRRWKEGTPTEVLNPTDLYVVFNVETQVYPNPNTLTPLIVQVPKQVHLNETNL